jgi:hypothetical protein
MASGDEKMKVVCRPPRFFTRARAMKMFFNKADPEFASNPRMDQSWENSSCPNHITRDTQKVRPLSYFRILPDKNHHDGSL